MKLFQRRKIEKSYLIVLGTISLFLIVGYFSYALFTVKKEQKEAIRIITGTLTGELKVNGTVTDRLTVNQGETKEFTVTLRNNNERTARYLLYYIGTLPEGLEVGYTSGGSIPPSNKNITKETTETYIIKVKNGTTSSQTIQLKLGVGLEKIDLTLPGGGHLFEEMQDATETDLFLMNHVNEENAEFSDATKDKMFVFHHEETEQQKGWSKEELTDYRYIGKNPNNYAKINGDSYRIIGVFTVENENGEKKRLIKVMKDISRSILSYVWADNETANWTNSLAKDYLTKNSAQELAENVKWYLGGVDFTDTDTVTASKLYSSERGTTVYNDSPLFSIDKIGLIYPSDYMFSIMGNEDNRDTWMYDDDKLYSLSTMTLGKYTTYAPPPGPGQDPSPTGTTIAVVNMLAGATYLELTNYHLMAATFYLTSDVNIIDGIGSLEEPFVFTK